MRKLLVCTLLTCSAWFVGCSKSNAPAPLTDANFSAELNKSFENSKPETKQIVQQASASFESKQFVSADAAISGLLSRPDLSNEERQMASRALISLNQKIQQAAEQGDPVAQQMQKMKAASK